MGVSYYFLNIPRVTPGNYDILDEFWYGCKRDIDNNTETEEDKATGYKICDDNRDLLEKYGHVTMEKNKSEYEEYVDQIEKKHKNCYKEAKKMFRWIENCIQL